MSNSGKHPSFYNQPIPVHQLLGRLTPFNNGVDPRNVKPKVLAVKPTKSAVEILGSKTISDNLNDEEQKNYNYINEKDHKIGMNNSKGYIEDVNGNPLQYRGKTISETRNRSSEMANLIVNDSKVPEDYENQQVLQSEIDAAAKKRAAESIIGGQASGPWKSSTQSANEGEESMKVLNKGKKTSFSQASSAVAMVSPITGDNMADYGSWRDDAANKLAYEKAAAIAISNKNYNSSSQTMNSIGHPLLDKIRITLISRGASGLLGMARLFRIMDDDNSKCLSLIEFKKAMRECALNLQDSEVVTLFELFDRDRSNAISYEEFIAVLRVSKLENLYVYTIYF